MLLQDVPQGYEITPTLQNDKNHVDFFVFLMRP